MNGVLVAKHFPREALDLLKAANDVVEGGADEKVLLLEAKLLALVGAVAWVKNVGNVLCALFRFRRRVIVARVEGCKVKLSRRKALPQAKTDCVPRVVACRKRRKRGREERRDVHWSVMTHKNKRILVYILLNSPGMGLS